jgi:two-component system chemotaxis sensor kinase CheA
MQGLLSNARGYSGTTLLGNGEVLLVLDLREILP